MRIIESAKKKKKSKNWNPNPWAVCHTTTNKKKDPAKYERCVKDVKKKQKKEAQSFDMGDANNSGLENDLSGVDNNVDPVFGMGIDLVGIYTKENYLSYVVTLEEYQKAGSSFWIDYLGEDYDPSSMKITMLKDVSEDDAANLLTQGTGKQIFRDGYEAAQVAAPYIEGSMMTDASSYFDITKIAQGDDELEDVDVGEDEPSTGKNVDDDYAKNEPDPDKNKKELPPWLQKIKDKKAQSNMGNDMNSKKTLGPDNFSYFFKDNKDYNAYIDLLNKNPQRAEEMMVQLVMNGKVTKKPKFKKSSSYFDITKIAQDGLYDGDWGDFDSDNDFTSSPEPDDLQEFSDKQAWEDSQGEMMDDFNDDEEFEEEEYYTIEPAKDGGFVAKKHDTYPRGSVLEGRPRDVSLDFADTVEELMDKYPGAEVLDHASMQRTTYEDAMNMPRPDDFDEMDAGEKWEQEEEPRTDYENDTPLGQEYGDGFGNDLDN